MRALIKRRTATLKDQDEWQDELAFWGVQDPVEDEEIELWFEHKNVVSIWLSVPGFLKFNGAVCLGMDVLAVEADMRLSGIEISPADYQKLKLIGRTLTEELNERL